MKKALLITLIALMSCMLTVSYTHLNLTLNKILEYLQKISIKKIRGSFYNPSLHVKKNLIDKYKQVAIYPFNKEMHSFCLLYTSRCV